MTAISDSAAPTPGNVGPADAAAAGAKSPDAPPHDDLLQVSNLSVRFPDHAAGRGAFREVVSNASLRLAEGETLGLVGGSGSGKTTLGRAILRLAPAASGRVHFRGEEVLSASGPALKRLRAKMQIIFQDPAGALDPRMRIGETVAEPFLAHGVCPPREAGARAAALLETCGLPADSALRYPHEFSGGQRQRICIARALALRPDFLVCDEPTSALDVSVQAQILNLLRDLQDQFRLSYLFISHDIAVIRHMCDRIAVMDRGRIVEEGASDEVINRPAHPCTRALIAAAALDPGSAPGKTRAEAGSSSLGR